MDIQEGNKLIHEIAGMKFVFVELPFVEGYQKKGFAIVEKYKLLYQGIKAVDRGGLFGRAVIIQTYLCPEGNYLNFASDPYHISISNS